MELSGVAGEAVAAAEGDMDVSDSAMAAVSVGEESVSDSGMAGVQTGEVCKRGVVVKCVGESGGSKSGTVSDSAACKAGGARAVMGVAEVAGKEGLTSVQREDIEGAGSAAVTSLFPRVRPVSSPECAGRSGASVVGGAEQAAAVGESRSVVGVAGSKSSEDWASQVERAEQREKGVVSGEGVSAGTSGGERSPDTWTREVLGYLSESEESVGVEKVGGSEEEEMEVQEPGGGNQSQAVAEEPPKDMTEMVYRVLKGEPLRRKLFQEMCMRQKRGDLSMGEFYWHVRNMIGWRMTRGLLESPFRYAGQVIFRKAHEKWIQDGQKDANMKVWDVYSHCKRTFGQDFVLRLLAEPMVSWRQEEMRRVHEEYLEGQRTGEPEPVVIRSRYWTTDEEWQELKRVLAEAAMVKARAMEKMREEMGRERMEREREESQGVGESGQSTPLVQRLVREREEVEEGEGAKKKKIEQQKVQTLEGVQQSMGGKVKIAARKGKNKEVLMSYIVSDLLDDDPVQIERYKAGSKGPIGLLGKRMEQMFGVEFMDSFLEYPEYPNTVGMVKEVKKEYLKQRAESTPVSPYLGVQRRAT